MLYEGVLPVEEESQKRKERNQRWRPRTGLIVHRRRATVRQKEIFYGILSHDSRNLSFKINLFD